MRLKKLSSYVFKSIYYIINTFKLMLYLNKLLKKPEISPLFLETLISISFSNLIMSESARECQKNSTSAGYMLERLIFSRFQHLERMSLTNLSQKGFLSLKSNSLINFRISSNYILLISIFSNSLWSLMYCNNQYLSSM